ncbi:beta-lactamase/transpeptidase-like protein [Phaeosphaeria sp. MPI-PUGE-AT-0046c]|nr:beta-lactamase/transpeptidase-like protein [Phaeosphaeria sp. MPI-PUGE-AT-0046c]
MRTSYLLASCQVPLLVALASYCPPLGPVFPPLKSLSTSASFRTSLASLEASILDALSTSNTSHGPLNSNDTYSIQLFSTSDEKPLLDIHHRGRDVVGNRTIDGNSVYRIASTTKVITVYLLLLAAGDGILNDLVTKHLPELAGKGYWDDITIGSLAGYMSGITADAYDITAISGGGLGAAFPGAFPELSPEEISPCASGEGGCTRANFLKHVVTRRPLTLPNTTPAYSNTAFAVLGLVLEEITGLSYADNLRLLLNDPLKLLSTTTTAQAADLSRAVIIGSSSDPATGWNLTLDGPGIGMGALYSSPNDMSSIGRAILSATLLPQNTTRAWLKPTSHTSSLMGAVGQPWEIFRSAQGPPENNRVVDLYTKGGNYGGYGANLVLIPDYNVGFVAIMAGRRGRVPYELSGLIVDQLLPALDEAARLDADAAFAGTYRLKDKANSTLKLSTAVGVPGMIIEQWLSNGTDIAQGVFGSPKTFQMYPTNIKSEDGQKQSWRSSFISLNDVGAFSACPSWVVLDRPTYGVYGLDEFEFSVDENGKATSVEPIALKQMLLRE